MFAQMEREACGERVKEAIGHIRGNGYHFGKAPMGKGGAVGRQSRYRVLVDDPAGANRSSSDQVNGRSEGELPKRLRISSMPRVPASQGEVVDCVRDLQHEHSEGVACL